MGVLVYGLVRVVEATLLYVLAFAIADALESPIPPVGSQAYIVFVMIWPFAAPLLRPALQRIPIIGEVSAVFDQLARSRPPSLRLSRRPDPTKVLPNPEETSEPAELARIMTLRFEEMARGRPFYRIRVVPHQLNRSALDTSSQGVQELFRAPVHTREGGWTIWGMRDLRVAHEEIDGTARNEQRVVALSNGYVEFTHPARSDFFQIGQAPAEAVQHPWLFPVAVCEFTASFTRFCAGLYRAGGLAGLPVTFTLELVNVRGFRLPPGLSEDHTQVLEDPGPYARDLARACVEVSAFPADPDPIAYELLSRIYQEFGNPPGDVPLFDAARHFSVPPE